MIVDDANKACAGLGKAGLDCVLTGKLRREIGVSKADDSEKAYAGLSKAGLCWVMIRK